jgi:hypothetical protein
MNQAVSVFLFLYISVCSFFAGFARIFKAHTLRGLPMNHYQASLTRLAVVLFLSLLAIGIIETGILAAI